MFKKTLLVTLMITILFTFSFGLNDEIPKKVIKYIDKATSAFKSGDMEKTNKFLEKAKEAFPNYAPIYNLYGQISINQKDNKKALEFFAKALTIDPSHEDTKGRYIDLLIEIGQNNMKSNPQAAILFFDKVLKIKDISNIIPKKTSQLAFMVGQLYQKQKKLKESSLYFKKFLDLPNTKDDFASLYSIAYYHIGINSLQINDLDNSSINLLKYIELNPTVTDKNRNNLSFSNYIVGSNNYEILEKQTKSVEDDKKIKTNKEKILKQAEIGKTFSQKIIPFLKKANELNPKIEDCYKYLGNFYAVILDFDNAIVQFNTLITNFPNSKNIASYKSILDALKKKKNKK